MSGGVTARPQAKLYSSAMLGLAAELALYPLDVTLPLRAEARSRSCGSVITLGLALDAAGQVARIGMQVSACAIGQASASLLARGIMGARPQHITATGTAIEGWLAGAGALPDWPGLDLLAPALAHPGRHGALILPWKAATMALSSAAARG
jgi:NifU-like protein involved in Fe-S cluster formation